MSRQQKRGLPPCYIVQALTHDGTSQQAAGSSCGHKTLACGILHAISKLVRRAHPAGFPGRCVRIQVSFTLQSLVRQERSNNEDFTTQDWKPGSVKRHSKLLSGPCTTHALCRLQPFAYDLQQQRRTFLEADWTFFAVTRG